MRTVDVDIDVAPEVGQQAGLTTAATICLPDEVPADPVICFAFTGGGYNRSYFTRDLLGDGTPSQAELHTSRGWIFVAVDHLGCGGSTRVRDMAEVTWQHLVDANESTVRGVLRLLSAPGGRDDLPTVESARVLGLGQSMGAALLILQQGQNHTFQAVGVLGWSARHAVSWLPPGAPRSTPVYFPRGTDVGVMTRALHTTAMPEMAPDEHGLPATASGFHYDDVARELVLADLVDYPLRRGRLPFWATDVIPPSSMTMMSPGAVAAEAAMIRAPVFVGVGERDVAPHPRSEPAAYLQSSDVTVYMQPCMGHMHNFASTRLTFWNRIHAWAEGVLLEPAPITAGIDMATAGAS
ncbi:hypothetical protein [Parafrankia sp. FMc2]|uniref:hypothetical protein n=1 Tax=Parafrankia sp. FMc2 TaxID=3233196 RepID=UPI0034D51C9C